tara:strand:+ start:13962 stop:14630 length:669 start_codon:yes stop_codon:yes gene_type:complete
MAILIQANSIGSDAGPFDLFSQVNGFTEAFETNITAVQLLVGFVSYNAPVGTSIVRIVSTNPDCAGTYEDIDISTKPNCPAQTIVISICNNSATIQDNFDIVLNGVTIGSVDLSAASQDGSVMVASNVPQIITQPNFACPLGNMTLSFFDPSLISYRNTIEMVNTQNNGNGNIGVLDISNYNVVGNQLETPCEVAEFTFSGASGDDFEFTWYHQYCCDDGPF